VNLSVTTISTLPQLGVAHCSEEFADLV